MTIFSNETHKLYVISVQKQEVVQLAKRWAEQGSRSKWSTGPSLALYDAVQELVELEEADVSTSNRE